MHNYRKFVNEIRKKSFPEIKGDIWIIKIPFPIPGGMALWLFPTVSLVAFSTACKKLNKKVVIGIIAHELSHFSLFQKGTWIQFWKFSITANKKQVVKCERETDRLAIKKGYGKELIATKMEAKKLLKGTRWEKMLDNYLTIDEVKRYMEKIKNH